MDSARLQSATTRQREGSANRRLRRAGVLLARLLMDAVLLDAVVETWLSGSPFRLWVAAPWAVYAGLTIAALVQGSRLAVPGLVTQVPAPFYLLLGVLVATTEDKVGMTTGLVMLRQPTAVVLAGVTLVVTALALWRLAGPKGVPLWLRVIVIAAGAYALYALGLAVRHPVPYASLLRGASFVRQWPHYVQGAFVGALVLVPAAFVRELGLSMAKVVLTGYLRWMLVFGLGAWIAINAYSL